MVIQHLLTGFYNEKPTGCGTQLAAQLYKRVLPIYPVTWIVIGVGLGLCM